MGGESLGGQAETPKDSITTKPSKGVFSDSMLVFGSVFVPAKLLHLPGLHVFFLKKYVQWFLGVKRLKVEQ